MLDASHRMGRVSHAYLITGPEQVGRRTLALDLACLLNCDPQPDLFGETSKVDLSSCPQCARIRKGLHADVRTIDVSTVVRSDRQPPPDEAGDGVRRQRISIEHIHDLQRDAALKPFEGRARVFIVDGAEDMSPEAANALLKTLEEPSPEVYIVLVASSPDALPETVVSRCQRIQLRPVKTGVIETALIERFSAEAELAGRLAKLSQGRPGWAISALQDPAVLELHTQTALRIVSVVSGGLEVRFKYARDLAGSFRRNREAVLNEMSRWLEWWRDVAVVKAGLSENAINSDWLRALQAIAAQLTEAEIADAAREVKSATAALRANAIPQLAIEVMVLGLPGATVPESAMAARE
jgi:DNA polymerase-3 subunit delta'